MRVSILVLLSLAGMAMCQRVPLRESLMGQLVGDTVSGARRGVSSVMNIFSTIGQGMGRMAGIRGGSRRQNRFRGPPPSGPNSFSGPNSLTGPTSVSGPAASSGRNSFDEPSGRPQRRRPQKKRQQQQQQQQFDDNVQRLSNDEILEFANPQPIFKKRNHRQPTHFQIINN